MAASTKLDFSVLCLKLFLACFLLHFALIGGDLIEDDEVVEEADEFDVYPGGEVHTFEQEKEGVKCKFTYSAQGGTNEKWLFMISHTPDMRRFHCTVERPDGNSYLFFLTFSFTIEGAKLQQVDISGKDFKELDKDQYITEGNTVKNSDKFQNSLSSVLITAKAGHKSVEL